MTALMDLEFLTSGTLRPTSDADAYTFGALRLRLLTSTTKRQAPRAANGVVCGPSRRRRAGELAVG